jgi:Glycosyltransferase family 28 C-terminal domain
MASRAAVRTAARYPSRHANLQLTGRATVSAPYVAGAAVAHVDAVVHHGGSGTTLGALSVGAPQLVLPQGADQFANADAVSAAGAGLVLLPEELSANAVAEQSHLLLPHHGDAGHRDAAHAIAEGIAPCPPRTRSPPSGRVPSARMSHEPRQRLHLSGPWVLG